MTGYYDLLLLGLPASLFGLSGAAHASGLGVVPSLLLGGLAASALTAHGLFVKDPLSASESDENRSDVAPGSAD